MKLDIKNKNIESKNFYQLKYNNFVKLIKSNRLVGYSNEEVINDITSLMFEDKENESMQENIGDQITKFFNKGKIIPVFTNKSTFFDTISAFWKKLSKKQTKVLAYFDPDADNITLLLTNLRDFRSGNIHSKNLTNLLIHEIIHYCAKNNITEFKKLFSQNISDFYKIFYRKLYGTDIFDKMVHDHLFDASMRMMTKCMIFNEKNLESGNIVLWPEIINPLHKYIAKKYLNPEETKVIDKACTLLKELILNYEKVGKSEEMVKKFAPIHLALYKTYQERFPQEKILTFPYQELLAPSEIISISSEFDRSKEIFELINSTEMRK